MNIFAYFDILEFYEEIFDICGKLPCFGTYFGKVIYEYRRYFVKYFLWEKLKNI